MSKKGFFEVWAKAKGFTKEQLKKLEKGIDVDGQPY